MKIPLKILLLIPLLTLFSCDEVLLEDDLSDKQTTLVAPVNNAEFNSTGIVFTWTSVENASHYRLQIAKPDFANPMQIVLDTLVSSTSYSAQLNVGNYEWRVKAINSAYETPYVNRFFSVLSNEDFENNMVTLQNPANNLITNAAAQNLSWQSIIGAQNYQVQIYDSLNNAIADETVTGTNLNFTFPNGSFQWRVRASNGTVQTMFSSRSLLVDTVVPNTPTLSAPVNAGSLSETEVDFQWNRTPVPGSAEKDSIYIYSNSAMTILHLKNEATGSTFTSTLDPGTYYWRVKAFDAAGNVGTQSSAFSFTVE